MTEVTDLVVRLYEELTLELRRDAQSRKYREKVGEKEEEAK